MSEADLEVLADAVSVMPAAPALTVERGEKSPPASRGLSPMAWTAIAAAFVGIIALPLLRRDGTPGVTWRLEDSPVGTLSSATIPAVPWGASRGADGALSATGRSVRIGARLADARQLVRGDTALSAVLNDLASLIDAIDGAAPIAAAFRSAAGAKAPAAPTPATIAAALKAAGDAATSGAWLESARLAAVRQDAAFFEANGSPAALAMLATLPIADRDAAQQVVASIQMELARTPRSWPRLSATLDSAMATLAR